MKVILTEDVAGLGVLGSLVQVKPGYGRNYLIPRKLAIPALAGQVRHLEHQKRLIEKKKTKILDALRTLAGKINRTTIQISKLVGENDKIFGSVTTAEVSELLAQAGLEVNRKNIHLPEGMKSLGSYKAEIRLHAEISAHVKIQLVKRDEEKTSAST